MEHPADGISFLWRDDTSWSSHVQAELLEHKAGVKQVGKVKWQRQYTCLHFSSLLGLSKDFQL